MKRKEKGKREGGSWFSALKTRNKILVITAAFVVLFIFMMQLDFMIWQSIPDTLCTCVLSVGGVVEAITGGMSIAEIFKHEKEN